jgi:chromosome segregation ATPase
MQRQIKFLNKEGLSMSDLEAIKKENETLKQQLAQNSQGVQNLLTQIDALKGELADSRTISMQLRMNLITAQTAAKHLNERVGELQKELDAATESKSAEVPPAPLKEVANKGK